MRGGHTTDQDLYKKYHRFLPGVNTTRNLVEAFHRPQVSSAFISQGLLNRNHPACHRQLPPSQPPTIASLIIATQITNCRLYIAARSLTFITCTSYVHHMYITCTSHVHHHLYRMLVMTTSAMEYAGPARNLRAILPCMASIKPAGS